MVLNHCLINFVDVCSCFIPLTQPFIDKIKSFHSIFISFISSNLKSCSAKSYLLHSLSPALVNLLNKKLVPLNTRALNPAPHSVKSVRIRSYSGPYFPAFGKIRTRITPSTYTFHAVPSIAIY